MSVEFYRGSDSVTFKDPEFGDETVRSLNQAWGMTSKGAYFFEDPDFQTNRMRWDCRAVQYNEYRDFWEFYRSVVKGGIETFHIKISNRKTALIKPTIYCGMTVSGTTIYSGMTLEGSTIYSGQTAAPDYLYFENCRFIDTELNFRDNREGWVDVVFNIVIEGFLWSH